MCRVAGVTLIASVGLGTLAAGALVRRRVEGGETGISLRSLQEMRRVLRPGGRVVLSIDAQKDAETARRSEQQWGLPAWTEDELLSLMAQAGFGQVCLSRDGAAVFARAVKATSTFQGETLTNRQPGA